MNSYEALGLAASLNPIASGGTERPLTAREERSEGVDTAPSSSSKPPATAAAAAAAASGSVPKGFGKIIRDADGNVVDVQLADEDEEEDEAAADDGGLEEVADPRADARLASWAGLGSSDRTSARSGGGGGIVQGERAAAVFGTGGLAWWEGMIASPPSVLLILVSWRRTSGRLPGRRAIALIWFIASVGAAVRGACWASAAVDVQGRARDAAAGLPPAR